MNTPKDPGNIIEPDFQKPEQYLSQDYIDARSFNLKEELETFFAKVEEIKNFLGRVQIDPDELVKQMSAVKDLTDVQKIENINKSTENDWAASPMYFKALITKVDPKYVDKGVDGLIREYLGN